MKSLFGIIALLTLALSPTQYSVSVAGFHITAADMLLPVAFAFAASSGGLFKNKPPVENLVFICIACIAVLFSGNLREGVKELIQLVLYFFVCERVFALAGEKYGEKFTDSACRVFIFTGTVITCVAVVQYFMPDSEVFPLCLRAGLSVRGTFSNNNVLCGFLALFIPFAFTYFLNERSICRKTGFAILVVAGLFTMFSGAALAAVTLVISAAAFRHGRIFGAATAVIMLIAFFVAAPLLPRDNFTSSVQSAEIYHSDSGEVRYSDSSTLTYGAGEPTRRYPEWQAALMMSLERPFLGVGPGTYQKNVGQFYDAVPRATGPCEPDIQNLYLVIASTMGWPALLAFVGMLYSAWNSGRNEESPVYARAASAAIAAFAITSIWHPLLVRGIGIPLVFMLVLAHEKNAKQCIL